MKKVIASIAMTMALASAPAGAMTMPSQPAAAPAIQRNGDIVEVHYHAGGHNRGHGADNYYDNDTDSGVLFKSFVTGTLFDGNARRTSERDDHIRACASRYRSYRASDNSYQPNHGPRRQCR